MAQVNFPKSTNRTVVPGSTGSGKTTFGVWLLGSRDWDVRRWFIFDFKGDDLIDAAVKAAGGREISVHSRPPKAPGIYVIRPLAERDDEAVEKFLYYIWQEGYAGVYFDEGYMVPKGSSSFRGMLTQGRSKHIEMITLSQRPVWMDRFVFSEAEYFAIFRLNDIRDRKTVAAMTGIDVNYRLPEFHFIWYDGGADRKTTMLPVPSRENILAMFRRNQRKVKKV